MMTHHAKNDVMQHNTQCMNPRRQTETRYIIKTLDSKRMNVGVLYELKKLTLLRKVVQLIFKPVINFEFTKKETTGIGVGSTLGLKWHQRLKYTYV